MLLKMAYRGSYKERAGHKRDVRLFVPLTGLSKTAEAATWPTKLPLTRTFLGAEMALHTQRPGQ